MLGMPVKLKKTSGKPQGPSPLLGQHTEEILAGMGYKPEDITEMEKGKIIRTVARKGKS
jgi:crotonobetainyl-CoA:carnitine CoA-transferase CaiB-like acyl-CoA transferase